MIRVEQWIEEMLWFCYLTHILIPLLLAQELVLFISYRLDLRLLTLVQGAQKMLKKALEVVTDMYLGKWNSSWRPVIALTPLHIQPVVVVRGLKRQQVATLTNFVGCFFSCSVLLLFSLLLCWMTLLAPALGLWPEKHIPIYSYGPHRWMTSFKWQDSKRSWLLWFCHPSGRTTRWLLSTWRMLASKSPAIKNQGCRLLMLHHGRSGLPVLLFNHSTGVHSYNVHLCFCYLDNWLIIAQDACLCIEQVQGIGHW